jgi:hypothetical protein
VVGAWLGQPKGRRSRDGADPAVVVESHDVDAFEQHAPVLAEDRPGEGGEVVVRVDAAPADHRGAGEALLVAGDVLDECVAVLDGESRVAVRAPVGEGFVEQRSSLAVIELVPGRDIRVHRCDGVHA